MHVYAVQVPAKDAEKTIRRLNEQYPVEELRHLKRIRRLPAEDPKLVELIVGFAETHDAAELGADLGLEVLECRVPSVGPACREQYDAFNAVWPVVFHQSMLEKQAREDLAVLERVYARFSDMVAPKRCLIVDPDTAAVVGHADADPDPGHPLNHDVLQAIEHVASRARAKLFPPAQYLCTGFVVLLAEEPCFMCAMALVHSRVRAVVFVQREPRRGAYCSQTDCSWVRSCNHRYQIYQAA